MLISILSYIKIRSSLLVIREFFLLNRLLQLKNDFILSINKLLLTLFKMLD
jgi:hypothetical protein